MAEIGDGQNLINCKSRLKKKFFDSSRMVVDERDGVFFDVSRTSFFQGSKEDGLANEHAFEPGFEVLGVGELENKNTSGFEYPMSLLKDLQEIW